jgi:hypothetical protein
MNFRSFFSNEINIRTTENKWIISGVRVTGGYLSCFVLMLALYIYPVIEFTYNIFSATDISVSFLSLILYSTIFCCFLIFSFRFKITINKSNVIFSETFLGISFLNKNFPIDLVANALKLEPYSNFQTGTLMILWEDDPWSGGPESDWLEIKYNDKLEYSVGNKNNVEKILNAMKKACESLQRIA